MKQRSLLLWISSLVALLVAYTVVAGALRRPDILPTTPEILQTFGSLLVRGNPPPAGEMHHEHHQHPMRSSDQVDTLVQQGVTLQDALLVSTARVLFGLLVGLPLGILIGVLLGWSRRADDYLHSVGGLRYAVAIAWMTAVGAEMLMAENGMGNLLVGGGMWSSRTQTRSDPAVIIAGVITLAAAGWAMDALARMLTARLTRWVR